MSRAHLHIIASPGHALAVLPFPVTVTVFGVLPKAPGASLILLSLPFLSLRLLPCLPLLTTLTLLSGALQLRAEVVLGLGRKNPNDVSQPYLFREGQGSAGQWQP